MRAIFSSVLLLVACQAPAGWPDNGGDAGGDTGDGGRTGGGSDGSSATGCALPWGGTIAEGASVTAYGNPLLVSGSKYRCPSETRTCSGGVLSGALANATCASAPTGCDLPWGGTIAIGDSVTAYGGPYSPDCASNSTTRTCQSTGLLSGVAQFQSQSCTADGANDCTLDGVLVPYGTSITVYQSPQVVGTCTSGQLKCVHDGGTEFTGTGASYRFTSCVASSAGCNPNDTADLMTSSGTPYTRQCQGSVNLNPPNGMAYNVVLAQFGDVFGFADEDGNTTGWPGTFEGLPPTFSIHLGQFVSLAFHANPARTIQINQNPSFGSNEIAVTISRRPGVFTASDPDMICANAAAIVSSSGFASTSCIFSDDPNETYYLNFALPPDQDCNGAAVSCPAAYTPYFVY